MTHDRQQRGWIWIAAIAIGVALVLLLALHAHSGDAGGLFAILPLLIAGIISPLSLLSPLAFVYQGREPDAPALAALFQRPPPFTLA
jgi:predicted membrane metal-binding protein